MSTTQQKSRDMRELAKYIESAGYAVREFRAGDSIALEVADPVHSGGAIIGTQPVRLYRPADVHKFINERS